MVLPSRRMALVGAVMAASVALTALAVSSAVETGRSQAPVPDLVALKPGAFPYRLSGVFAREGKPASAPAVSASITATLAVMKHQVSEADYLRCADAGACAMIDRYLTSPHRPRVKVSWLDAHAYAAWLSKETGMRFRLPSDEEWAYAAGSRFTDDALPDSVEASDPGRRALAIYERDASRRDQAIGQGPQPIGSFGTNENGLLDLAGNVWEWTDTCFTRNVLDARGEAIPAMVSCGIRVVEGRHRTYVPDFIRDARAGGCAAGTPPSYLGFRLVRDDSPWLRLPALRDWRKLVSLSANEN